MVANMYYLVSSWLSVPLWVLGILTNFGDWKGTILFILASIALLVRLYFFILKQLDDRKKRRFQMDIDLFDFEIKKRENEEA